MAQSMSNSKQMANSNMEVPIQEDLRGAAIAQLTDANKQLEVQIKELSQNVEQTLAKLGLSMDSKRGSPDLRNSPLSAKKHSLPQMKTHADDPEVKKRDETIQKQMKRIRAQHKKEEFLLNYINTI